MFWIGYNWYFKFIVGEDICIGIRMSMLIVKYIYMEKKIKGFYLCFVVELFGIDGFEERLSCCF